MSAGYRAVQWSRHIRRYDLAILLGVLGYLLAFMLVSSLVHTGDHAISPPILLIRAFGSCAILLLHVVLCIGPLSRLDPRFLPLLYNRRHLGVTTFLVALLHVLLVLGWYHGFGIVDPISSLFTSNTQVTSLAGFPFEWLGVVGFVILYLMAATSHDFWLHNLSPRTWKRLHMLVYVAWASLMLHVALGTLSAEPEPVSLALFCVGLIAVPALHLLASLRERRRDNAFRRSETQGMIDAGAVDTYADGRANIVQLEDGERIAVFRHGDCFSALTNVCAHQGGPLGEGRIVDGCVTCPWHGYQYRPADGQSPPPFTERVATYDVQVRDGRVWVGATPHPPGTPVTPALITTTSEVNDG